MGLGARGSWAVFIVGTLLVLALLKVVVDSEDPAGSSSGQPSTFSHTSTTQPTGNTTFVSSVNRNESSHSTVKPSTNPVSPVTSTTSKSSAKPSTPVSSRSVTATTLKPTATSQMTTQGVSANMTSTTLKSTPKITSVSQHTSQMSTSTMATTHNSSATSVSSSVTITATINSKENKGSKFDIGSFVGGIALTLGMLSILYVGCRMYYSRRGIQYRTIDEHDAII
ncbi:porimin [Myotis myotis]|uniref:Transmembrane protein 123 n=1 Tax=Myotis myotis TaxID=51298 RepID=A0A7J7VKZ3_MYOMY|nr:porimin [Myotis myotis]KAF6325844.1 transmembrane protein 123 [Myotis myotis]